MTDKITVELDRELAENFIKGTSIHGGPIARVRDRLKAALPPEWEEGTLARITTQYDGTYLAEFREGKWVVGRMYEWQKDQWFEPHAVTNVEPIRVLKDDEVAVKRFRANRYIRGDISAIEAQGYLTAAAILRDYADALEAEK